jgi:hypothetical protein
VVGGTMKEMNKMKSKEAMKKKLKEKIVMKMKKMKGVKK